MQYTQPDMLMFDMYPGYDNYIWYPYRNLWYSTMQRYRTVALEGYDGTGDSPLPYGQYLDLWRRGSTAALPPESFVRLQQFASWAFGFTCTSAFIYNMPATNDFYVQSAMFDGQGDDPNSKTAVYDYVAESNRQSLNLGSALTRLVSTDIRMIPGWNESVDGTGITAWDVSANNGQNYISSITPTQDATGLADPYYHDILVGYFKPLLDDNSDYPFADGQHFMIVNGTPFFGAEEKRQWYRVNFDFGNTGISGLERINRDTGLVEEVPLTHLGGSQYQLDFSLPGGTGDLFRYILPTVHYTFKEISPGKWEVYIEVTGDTAGLAAYEIWVDGVDPATVSFEENVLSTVVGENFDPVGFLSSTFLQGEAAGSFNAGNFQSSGAAAIEGIGLEEVYEPGSIPGTTPLVNLDAKALLGILTSEEGLTEENFRVIIAGLLNGTGDGFLNTDDLVPTLEVIPFVRLPGDANHDGVVSAGDYASVQANFGNTGSPGIEGDANFDGVVSAGDYASVQANFGNTNSEQTVPEPGLLSILGICGLTILNRRR